MDPTARSAFLASPRSRRGNTLVLVTAILVLLVIIATAFITRTQDGRKLATVQGHAFQREESASIYAEQLAGELSRSLFPAAVDPIEQAYVWGFPSTSEGAFDWLSESITDSETELDDNGNKRFSAAELLAERALTGSPRASGTRPLAQLYGYTTGGEPGYLENKLQLERFGTDVGDFVTTYIDGDGFARLEVGSDGFPDFNQEFVPRDENGRVLNPGAIDYTKVPGFFDFNFAPYETRAWTNWPDDTGFGVDPGNPNAPALLVPHGPGAKDSRNGDRLRTFAADPNGDAYGIPIGSGNPRGNPGFGDTRWLRDSEPRRLGPYYDGSGYENADLSSGNAERFTHWTHLSWIPTALNGWRVCYDISNVARFNPDNYNDFGPYGSIDYGNEDALYETGPNAGYTLDTTADSWEFGAQRPYHDALFPVALQTPYEQWYPNVIPEPIVDPDDGTYLFDAETFIERRDRWFSSPLTHFNGSRRESSDPPFPGVPPGLGVLPNYLDLELLGPESDRFLAGTNRNVVERTYADADGDGFTDSFWFLSPFSPTPGVKQVVGVSIVDNGGMLNANVATVFDRWTTSGATPADLALVSRLNLNGASDNSPDDDQDTWVGLLGDPKNQVADEGFYPAAGEHLVTQRLDFGRWFATPGNPGASRSFLNERGLDVLIENNGEPGPFYGQYRSVGDDLMEAGVRERKLWNSMVQNDFSGQWVDESDPANPQLQPFTAKAFGYQDELELRSFAGLNHASRFSRLEGALGDHVSGSDADSRSILRGDLERPETGPVRTLYLGNDVPRSGKNINRQQVRDVRHRMTLFSGARNEYRPAWLWSSLSFNRDKDYDRDGATFREGDRNDYQAYQRLQQKIDLAQTHEVVNEPAGSVGGDLWLENRRRWLLDLQEMIAVATSRAGVDPLSGTRTLQQSYFSNPTRSLDFDPDPLRAAYLKTQKMAASYAANIETWRDGPLPYTVTELNDLVTRNNVPIYLDTPLHPLDATRVPVTDQYEQPLDIVSVDLNGDGTLDFEDNPQRDGFIGMEKQPFITQAFYSLIYPRTQVSAGPAGTWESGDSIPEVQHPQGYPTYFSNASENDTDDATGEGFVDDRSKPAVLLAIQLANPFDEPISLYDYALKIGDKQIALKALNCPHSLAEHPQGTPNPNSPHGTNGVNPFGWSYYHNDLYLGPTDPDAPRTAVVFALIPPSNLGYGEGFKGAVGVPSKSGFGVDYEVFKQACLDYLDLQEGDLFGYEENMSLDQHQSLVLDASRMISPGGLSDSARGRLFGYNGVTAQDHQPLIQLIRTYIGETAFTNVNDTTAPDTRVNVVVDRFQHERVNDGDITREVECSSVLARLFERAAPPEAGNEFKLTNGELPSGPLNWSGIRLGDDDDYYMTWASFSRFWGWDVDGSGIYDLDELSPRYAYSVASKPILGLEESEDLVVTGSEEDSYDRTGWQGDTFARSSFSGASGEYTPIDPNNDEWIRRVTHAAPLTKPDAVVEAFTYNYQPRTNGWEEATNRPAPWLIRGKPFNFPTWTVVDNANDGLGGIGAIYDNGFPMLVHPNDPESLDERVTKPDGQPLIDNNLQYIPMDLVAVDQDEFYDDFREDLWNQPLQMLLKDDDFEQIGELNHVFLWGPVVDIAAYFNTPPGPFGLMQTKRTFAELMTEVVEYQMARRNETVANPNYNVPEWWNLVQGADPLPPDAYPVGQGVYANRLDFSSGFPASEDGFRKYDPGKPWRQVLGANLQTPTSHPLLAAGAGIFDGVTVDGRGVRANDADYNGDGTVSDYEQIRAQQDNPNLARGFSGEPTRGLININTASPEVLRALPQMSRLIYNDYFNTHPYSYNQVNRSGAGVKKGPLNFMHVRLAEAIERYRLGDYQFRANSDGGYNDWVPSYADRGYRGNYAVSGVDYQTMSGFDLAVDGFYPGMRNDAGIVSLGELLTMDRTQLDEIYAAGGGTNAIRYLGGESGNEDLEGEPENYGVRPALDFRLKSASIRALGLNPYGWSNEDGLNVQQGYAQSNAGEAYDLYGLGYRGGRDEEFDPTTSAGQYAIDARVSTDRNTERRSLSWLKTPTADLPETIYRPDMVGGDAEEANLLFSGIANLLTTRSDVFTVYFTIRSFKQDPITGFWDATDKAMVIDESRYVMVLDRSSVNGPTDQPRVLAFSKVE